MVVVSIRAMRAQRAWPEPKQQQQSYEMGTVGVLDLRLNRFVMTA